jgi:hypothetical protein
VSDLLTNPRQMFCPHCGTENPPYDFVTGSGQNIRMKVAYATVVCNALVTPQSSSDAKPYWLAGPVSDAKPYYCRRILSVAVLALEVTPGLVG